MEYSDKYAVDTTEQRYGVEYKYSKQIKDIMTLNSDFDESILYTKTRVTDFETMYQLPIQMNKNANSNWEYTLSKTIKDSTVYVAKVRDDLEEVIEKHGVVFTDSSGSLDKFYFGYNIDKNAVVGDSGGNRFLLDFKIQNIIFKVTVTGYKKSDVEGWLNKTSDNTISASNITFDELYEHPDDYYINKCEITSQGIYNADENKYSIYTGYRVFTTINAKKVATGLTPANSFNYNIALNSTAPFTFNLMAKGFTGGMKSNKLLKLDKIIDYVDFRDVVLEPYSDFIGEEASKTYYGKNEILKETDKYVIFGCHIASTTSGNKLKNYLVDVKIAFKPKAILTFLATLGVYFVGNGTSISTNLSNYNPDTIIDAVGTYTKTDGTTGDAYVYLGEMDSSGFTTGKLLRSEELKNYNGYNKNGNSKNENFNPDKSNGGDDIDEIGINDFPFNNIGGLARYYAIDKFQLDELVGDFKNSTTGIPLDAGQFVIGLYQFPINIPSICTTSQEKIVLGKLETNAVGKKLLTVNRKIHLGDYFISENCGNSFLDYSPYTEIKLYVPFCGMVELPPNLFINSTVRVDLIVDIISGSCKGMIMCNDTFYTSVNGSLMCSLPLSLEQCATKSLSIINSANSIMSGIIFGNKNYSALNTVTTLGEAMIENNNIAPSHISGNMDSVVNFYSPQCCILFISYPEVNMGDIGKTHGKVCNYQDTLNNCHGYTVVNNPHLEIKCTNTEKDEITKLLEQGVILP